MKAGALVTDGRAAGSERGERRGSKDQRVDKRVPPWRKWRTRSRAARCIRFIETYCRIPSGVGYGTPLRLHRYQRTGIERLLGAGVRTGGLQIPRGNAKSTLWGAVGLWAVCDHEDAPQVPLVAYNGLQAQRTLLRPVRRMVALEPELASRVVVYTSSADRRVWSGWNDGELLPLPADVERLQGLNPTVALIDEAQTIPPEVLAAILQGAGKRAASLVLAIGTPAPGAQLSALGDLRARAADGARVEWIEYAATAGCAIDDRREWRRANPALDAGLLFEDVLEAELETVPEHLFRMYRLGQWIEGTFASWIPSGAWDDCPTVEAPPDDTELVLALAGTWTSSIALVGATLDGEVFLAYWSETATDDDLEEVLSVAWERWQVAELVIPPRTRAGLARRLTDAGLPVYAWPARTDVEVSSSTEWRRAIVEGRVAHDHDPILAAHVAALVGDATPDGSLRLVAPDDGTDVAAARAARMAWWRALELGEQSGPAIY
jgi:phage terminase large subunit-like protein